MHSELTGEGWVRIVDFTTHGNLDGRVTATWQGRLTERQARHVSRADLVEVSSFAITVTLLEADGGWTVTISTVLPGILPELRLACGRWRRAAERFARIPP